MALKNKEYTKFCMNCGSTDLTAWVSAPESIDPRMICRECKAIAYPLEGNPEFIEEFKEKLKKGKE